MSYIPARISARKPLSKGVRFSVLSRDGFRCRYCGAEPSQRELHVDHLIPVSRNGPNHPCNYVTACGSCNLGKGSVSVLQTGGDDLSHSAVALMGYHSGEALSSRAKDAVFDFFLAEPSPRKLLDQIRPGLSVRRMIEGMYVAAGYPA